MIDTSDFLTAAECTKFVYGRPGPNGGVQRSPIWFKGVLLLMGGEGKERGAGVVTQRNAFDMNEIKRPVL